MSADYFLDTNVVIHAFDQRADAKRGMAQGLMEPRNPWVISWQVIQEFSSVALHRFATPLEHEFLRDYLDVILLPHCSVFPTRAIYQRAISVQGQPQYRFYDSLIVASALESGASVLYSEDLQHDRVIGPLKIVNPFLSDTVHSTKQGRKQ